MILNYTLQDALYTVAVIPVFAIFLLTPGYCLGMAIDLLLFRSRSIEEKLLLSIPFSVVISTVMANLIGRYVSANALLVLFCFSAVGAILHLTYTWWRKRKPDFCKLHITTKITIALASIWVIVVVLSLADIQLGGRLYINTALWDHAVRVAFLRSALRSGPPPKNPFSYLGSAPVARYYYYWYVLCSYPARLTGIDARCVFFGSSVWAGFSVAALIPLYLKYFVEAKENLRRKSVIGVALLSVTGLDILPTIYEFFRAKMITADVEWWDPVQITSWTDALLWVPHHVASLVACFIGFLALWSIRRIEGKEPSTTSSRLLAGVFAALAFAAAAGLSVYVTFTFAIFLCCWSLRLLGKRRFSDFLLYLSTGLLTIVISIPYLHDLLSSGAVGGATGAGSGKFERFGLRDLPGFLSTPYFLKIRGFVHPWLLFPFGLLAVYILEFGLFAIVGWMRLRIDIRNRFMRSESETASWYLVAISMFVITFLRSSVISNNDLAFRSAMITQFILLLWAAEYLDSWSFSSSGYKLDRLGIKDTVLICTLILGFVGTLYGLAILRFYSVLDGHCMIAYPADWLPAPPKVGIDLFDTRHAYQELDKVVPAGSIVQYNPMSADYLPLLMYTKFQLVDAFPDCGTEFGGDIAKCAPVQTAIADLFNKPGNYDIHQLCTQLSIDALIARESDPAWRDQNSWVWSYKPIIENSYIRMFRCK